QACAKGLTRNLDVASELGFPGAASADSCQKDPAKPQPLLDYISYEVFPLEMKPERMEFMRCTLKSGALRALVVHLSEGAPGDGSARREFRMLNATWLIQEGLVVVHGTALRAEDFQVLGKANAGLVWSPRSNEELYGDTTNVAAAAASQVAIAIAPDWSPTGSAGMLQELGYASRRTSLFANDKLVQMATSIPAKLARLDDRIGTLAPGKFADLVVVRGDRKRPFDAITRATPADIQLVVIGGRPIYGDAAVMKQLLPNATLESLTVCGAGKAINLANSAAGERHQSFADIQKLLSSALSKAGSSLAPIECN
uniref:amidohydrolase family protein n=1 Tax=Chitinimonas sp. TaxID=1934313 RepID=UPI0035ADF954